MTLLNLYRHDAREEIIERASIDNESYLFEGSACEGNRAKFPWIDKFEKTITTTATKGYDIVYFLG